MLHQLICAPARPQEMSKDELRNLMDVLNVPHTHYKHKADMIKRIMRS